MHICTVFANGWRKHLVIREVGTGPEGWNICWDWMSSSLLCLFTFPLPSWGGYAALSEDMWKRREKRREKNSGGGRQKWVTAAVTSLTAGWKWVVESRGSTKKKTGLSWSSLINNLVCFIIFGGKRANSSCPHPRIGPLYLLEAGFENG